MKRKGIRKRIWDQGTEVSQRDIAEFARDVDQALQSIPSFDTVITDVRWSLPFFLSCDHIPTSLLVSRVETPDSPTLGISFFPDPKWESDGSRIKITRCDGFVVGTRYRINWMLIG